MNITTEQVAALNAARTILNGLRVPDDHTSVWQGRVSERAQSAQEAITYVLIGLKVYADLPLTDDELHNRETVES